MQSARDKPCTPKPTHKPRNDKRLRLMRRLSVSATQFLIGSILLYLDFQSLQRDTELSRSNFAWGSR